MQRYWYFDKLFNANKQSFVIVFEKLIPLKNEIAMAQFLVAEESHMRFTPFVAQRFDIKESVVEEFGYLGIRNKFSPSWELMDHHAAFGSRLLHAVQDQFSRGLHELVCLAMIAGPEYPDVARQALSKYGDWSLQKQLAAFERQRKVLRSAMVAV